MHPRGAKKWKVEVWFDSPKTVEVYAFDKDSAEDIAVDKVIKEEDWLDEVVVHRIVKGKLRKVI